MARYYYSRDPYWLTAKFNSTCATSTCGKRIKRGDRIFYYPNGRKAVCEACGRKGEQDLLAEISMEMSGGTSDCMFDR